MVVCEACSQWVRVQVKEPDGPVFCGECGAEQPIRRLPLFIVTGPSGSGKTSVILWLRSRMPEVDVFETDQVWDSGGDWQMVKCNWMRVALAVAQSGRVSILCGTVLPDEVRRCDHATLFSSIHFLALRCSDEARGQRLRKRKGALAVSEDFIEEHHRLSRWLETNAGSAFDPPLRFVDTTAASPDETAGEIERWVREVLASQLSASARNDA